MIKYIQVTEEDVNKEEMETLVEFLLDWAAHLDIDLQYWRGKFYDE